MDDERARAAHEAYTLYVRLRWLLRDLPPDHPAHRDLTTAVALAHRHWLEQAAPPEDRVLDVAPARPQ